MVQRLSRALRCAAASAGSPRVAPGRRRLRARGSVDLLWDAPAECPSAASIEVEVAKLVPNMPSSQRWHARASVQKISASAWALHLSTEIDGHQDERDFTAASCAELASTAAVVLAIAVDTTRRPAGDSRTPASAPASPPPPSPPEPASSAAGPRRASSSAAAPGPSTGSSRPVRTRRHPLPRPLRLPPFAITAGAAGSLGVLATPALGAELGLAWTPRHARVELDALWFPHSVIQGGAGTGTGGTFELVAAALSGCWLPVDPRRVRLGPCASIQVGAARCGPALAAVTSTPASSPWVAGALERAPRVAVRAAPRPAAQLGPRRSVRAQGLRVSRRAPAPTSIPCTPPSPVAAQASLGLEAHFP